MKLWDKREREYLGLDSLLSTLNEVCDKLSFGPSEKYFKLISTVLCCSRVCILSLSYYCSVYYKAVRVGGG